MKQGKWRVSLKSLIWVRWQKYLPRLVIHEKYEKRVKWISRIVAIVAIVSSALTIERWYIGLSLALSIFLVEQFLERAIFLYTSIYIQPLSDFTIEKEKWTEMGFAFPKNPQPNELNVVGPVFSDKGYAHKFFNLLRDWNYRQPEDINNNICLSFISENEMQYSVYLYPNLKRKSVGLFFKQAEEQQKYEKHGKEHQQLVMLMLFCKVFRYGEGPSLKRFLEIQPKNKPFWLKPFLKLDNGTLQMIYEEDPILKYHFKAKRREELRKNEVEYQHRLPRSALR